MLDGLQCAPGVIGDYMNNLTRGRLLAVRLAVQCELCPARCRWDEQGARQKCTQGIKGDRTICPIIMVAIRGKEGGGKVEDTVVLDDKWRAQEVSDRSMGVAGEVLPATIEERPA